MAGADKASDALVAFLQLVAPVRRQLFAADGISTPSSLINLFERDEIELLRSNGVDNFKITTIVSLVSLIMGIILIFVYYSFSANLKSL